MSGLLPSLLVLGPIVLAAVLLARLRRSPADAALQRLDAARVFGIAVAVQTLHFMEEAVTGFHERFPALFGLPEIPLSVFLGFNLIWIGIWIASVPGVREGRAAGFFAAWFLAIAGMLNGIGHPLMALVDGGYFPGLVTSPLIGMAGLCLWRRLRQASSSSRA